MSVATEKTRFRFVPENIRHGVERAAAYEGHARGMLFNLANCPTQPSRANRIAIWEAEAEVWSQRKEQLVECTALQKDQLSEYAAELLRASIEIAISRLH